MMVLFRTLTEFFLLGLENYNIKIDLNYVVIFSHIEFKNERNRNSKTYQTNFF